MKSRLPIVLSLVLLLGATGCVKHVHHEAPPKKVAVLDTEHHDKTILVVYEKPTKHRHCWKHRKHWHCRVH